MSTKHKPELLAPAGSRKALEAAVKAGADAVYFGIDRFNARARAENFRSDEIGDVAAYCHARNAKAYLALNTLIKDNEMKSAFDIAANAWIKGIDAVIVQDIGLARLLIDNIEGIRLHASTQMTAFNINACRILKAQGFKRVVLARELSIDSLKKINDVCGIQTEVFIHGALCVSYSGQCLMSFVQGGRSSNRGECAQPCRQVWSLIDEEGKLLEKNKHLLSTRDLITTSVIKEIIAAGPSSLKIEGRLKDEIYVAAVTSAYRMLIDEEDADIEELNKMLGQIFLRGGGTKGFIGGASSKEFMSTKHPGHIGPLIGRVTHQKNDKAVMTLFEELNIKDSLVFIKDDFKADILISKIEQDGRLVKSAKANTTAGVGYIDFTVPAKTLVYRRIDVNLTSDIRERILKKDVNIGIRGIFTAKTGMSPVLMVEDAQTKASYTAIDTEVVLTNKRGTTPDDIIRGLSKTVDTPFYFENIKTDVDEGIYIPLPVINKMRREALFLLEKAKHRKRRDINYGFNEQEVIIKDRNSKPEISVYIEYPGAEDYTLIDCDGPVYLPIKHLLADIEYMYPDKLVFFLPLIDKNELLWKDVINDAYEKGYRKFLIKNVGQIGYFDGLDVMLYADHSMNIYNSYAANSRLLEKTIQVCVSLELMPEEIKRISSHKMIEAIVYGQKRVMDLEYELVNDRKQYILRDAAKNRDFIVRASDDTVSVFERRGTYNYMVKTDVMRLMFLDESISKISKILSVFMIEYDKREFVSGNDV